MVGVLYPLWTTSRDMGVDYHHFEAFQQPLLLKVMHVPILYRLVVHMLVAVPLRTYKDYSMQSCFVREPGENGHFSRL